MEFNEIKVKIKQLLQSPNPSAEQWADVMSNLQWLKPDLVQEARAREIIANKKFREMRKDFKTRVDTEDLWKISEEYLHWQEAKDKLDDLDGWQMVASRQVSAKYKSF